MANLFDLQAKITLDTARYERSVADAVKSANKLQSSFKKSEVASESNKNKLKLLSAQYKEAQRVVEDLSREFNRSAKTNGIASKKTEELGKKLEEAQTEANDLKNKLDSLGNSTEKTGGKFKALGGKISGALGKGVVASVKVGMAAIGAAATGIATLTTAAVNSYAEYEQLVGGVETLFKDSSDKVMEYADNAYKTAGMSANQYMETVTSFAGSLLQSVGNDTAKATEIADMAITDMSDNANKMGTSMESIQHAYMGFSKQTFVMLDNLKLGYGGTKGEMERLLADAEKLSGIHYDISSYADIVEAIHVIQGEMEISGRTAEEAAEIFERTGRQVKEQVGTTAKEASETIQGSLSAAKSAWSNLITGLADDNADLEKLMDNAVETTGTAFENLLPAIETALEGAGSLIERLFPVIMDRIPQIISETLPKLVESGINVLQSLVQGIQDNLPLIVESAFQIISTLIDAFVEMLPDILQIGADLLVEFLNGISEDPDSVVETAIEIIEIIATAIAENLPTIMVAGARVIAALLESFVEHIPEIFDAGIDFVSQVAQGIWEALPSIFDAGVSIVQSIVDGIYSVWQELTEWVGGLWDNLFPDQEIDISANLPNTKPGDYAGYGAGAGKGSGAYKPGGWLNGSHAMGLGYVPFDGYIAELHRGERVLTASESKSYNNGNERPITIVVQSVLDGKVIGETAYKYGRMKERAMG